MSYRLSPRALEDVEAIADYIATGDPAAASDLIARFAHRWELAAAHPYSGVGRDDLLPGLRHLIVDSYLTFYRVAGADIEIVRVLHGRRELSSEFEDPED